MMLAHLRISTGASWRAERARAIDVSLLLVQSYRGSLRRGATEETMMSLWVGGGVILMAALGWRVLQQAKAEDRERLKKKGKKRA